MSEKFKKVRQTEIAEPEVPIGTVIPITPSSSGKKAEAEMINAIVQSFRDGIYTLELDDGTHETEHRTSSELHRWVKLLELRKEQSAKRRAELKKSIVRRSSGPQRTTVRKTIESFTRPTGTEMPGPVKNKVAQDKPKKKTKPIPQFKAGDEFLILNQREGSKGYYLIKVVRYDENKEQYVVYANGDEREERTISRKDLYKMHLNAQNQRYRT